MKVDSALLRRWAYWGARYGPRPFLRYSPRLFGLGFALSLPQVRRRVRRNLRLVMGRRSGPVESYHVLRTFMNYAACLAEALGTERPEAEAANFRIEGAEHLESTLAAGRGGILLTAHLGPFEAAARYFSRVHQMKLMVVMHREADHEARQFHDQIRERMGMLVTHVGDHALDALPLLAHLESGGMAAIQLDRLPRQSREQPASFFGEPWPLPLGPLRLAALCGVPLLTVFARRCDFYDYELTIGEPIRIGREQLEGRAPEIAQRLAAEMERAILKDPTQWFHFVQDQDDFRD